MLLLHPEVGNYSSMKHPDFYFEEGERIDFYCPLCMQSLDAAMDENLVQVLMIDEQQNEQEIYFSRIAGKKRTYQVSEDGVEASGEHSYYFARFKMMDELVPFLN